MLAIGALHLGHRWHSRPMHLGLFNNPSCFDAPRHLTGNRHGVDDALAFEEDGIDLFQMASVCLGEEKVHG